MINLDRFCQEKKYYAKVYHIENGNYRNGEVKVVQLYLTLCNPVDCSLPGSSVHGDSPGKNTAVGCHSPLQGIFPTQGSNPGLPHCRWILYQVSHKGSPRILEWVAYPFSSRSSWSRNQTRVSCIAGGFFTNWATREAHSDGNGKTPHAFCLFFPWVV